MTMETSEGAPQIKRQRGRPRGSRNKPKVMQSPVVKFKANVSDPPAAPAYVDDGAAGMDVRAYLPGPGLGITILMPGGFAVVATGYDVEPPAGHEIQVRPRSGLAADHGVTVLNAPATIDSSYRGPLKIILINHGHEPFTIGAGDRIAQLVVVPVVRVEPVITSELSSSARGSNGLGSTGVK